MPGPIRDERYEVLNEDRQRLLRSLAADIDAELPEGMAFALFLIPFGEHLPEPAGQGSVFYISNAGRDGILDAIKAWVAKQEAGL